MIFPTVHLNGTSKKDLLEQLENAHAAIRGAIAQLAEAGPHARDYYVQKDPNAYNVARDEHCARMAKLTSVKRDLEVLAENISDQGRKS